MDARNCRNSDMSTAYGCKQVVPGSDTSTMQDVLTRPVQLPNDLEGLCHLDIEFHSDRVFQVKRLEDGGLLLVAERVAVPVGKRFPLMLDADPWTDGWVIEQGGCILGFVACAYNEWNKRVVIWHFYVDRQARRRGLGRRLMDLVMARGREWGARTAWVETSNLNYIGVVAYRGLGFDICGFDRTLYVGTPNEGEFGLFLARDIAAE
jgi:ribosomal protein S18 acetylase RimI-like enzyme